MSTATAVLTWSLPSRTRTVSASWLPRLGQLTRTLSGGATAVDTGFYDEDGFLDVAVGTSLTTEIWFGLGVRTRNRRFRGATRATEPQAPSSAWEAPGPGIRPRSSLPPEAEEVVPARVEARPGKAPGSRPGGAESTGSPLGLDVREVAAVAREGEVVESRRLRGAARPRGRAARQQPGRLSAPAALARSAYARGTG